MWTPDLDVRDACGRTWAQRAILRKHSKMLRAALSAAKYEPGFVEATNMWGQTALYTAAEEGSAEDVAALLAAGANPNAADCTGCTPLHILVISRSGAGGSPLRRLEVLLSASGIELDAGFQGKTPLQWLEHGQCDRADPMAAVMRKMLVARKKATDRGDDCCVICTDDLFSEAFVEIQTMIPCGHQYHWTCYKEW